MTQASDITNPSSDLNAEFHDMLGKTVEKNPSLVLYLEDDKQQVQLVKDRLGRSGVKIVRAENADEADQLAEHVHFDAVIVDWNLGEGRLNGEEWLLNNLTRLVGVQKFVLTGLLEELSHANQLREEGVVLVSKGDSNEDAMIWEKLPEIAVRKAKAIVRADIRDLEDNLYGDSSMVKLPGVDVFPRAPLQKVVEKKTTELFLKWTEKFGDQSSAVFSFSDRQLSAANLRDEVEKQTEIGLRVLELFVEDMIDSLELG